MKTTWIDRLLDRIFPQKSDSELLAEEIERTTIEFAQAQRTIHLHKFTEHMARRKLEALHEWHHKEMT